MNKHCLVKTVIATFLLAGIAQAREPKATAMKQKDGVQSQNRTGESEAVFDDDGGRVFILRRNAASLATLALRHHGGSVIAEPEQHSLFLGAGWTEAKRQASKIALSNLLGSLDNSDERTALYGYGVSNLFASSFTHEAAVEFDHNTVSDLRIRAQLTKMFTQGTLPAPSANAVYVVYLAPGLQSTLGPLFGGKHYLAYHNYINTGSGEIRYVVVPFEANTKHLQQVAQRALIEAVINPTGNGWY